LRAFCTFLCRHATNDEKLSIIAKLESKVCILRLHSYYTCIQEMENTDSINTECKEKEGTEKEHVVSNDVKPSIASRAGIYTHWNIMTCFNNKLLLYTIYLVVTYLNFFLKQYK